MPAKFISSAFEAPAASTSSSSKKHSRKPDWMKQHRCRPNMPNKENTDRFIEELHTELEAAKVRLHNSSIIDFTPREEIILQNIREKRCQIKEDLELAQEDLGDLKYDRQTIKLDLEAVEAQLEEMVMHEASLKALVDQSGPILDQEAFDEISSFQAMVDMQQEQEKSSNSEKVEESATNRFGAVSAAPSDSSTEDDDNSLRALGFKTANILHEFSQEHSYSSTTTGGQQFSYGLTWSTSASAADETSFFGAESEETNNDFVYPTVSQFANAQRLTAFYLRYAPEKVAKVWEALQMYAGREETLFEELEAHYCPEGLCPSLEHYKPKKKVQQTEVVEQTPFTYIADSDPFSSYAIEPEEEDCSPGPTTVNVSSATSEATLYKEPELYQPSHGLTLNSRQKLAQAALPEVAIQIHALQLNVKGLKNAVDIKNREIKQMNCKINSLLSDKKKLDKESGALYYQYAGPSEASRKREKSRIEFLESRIAKTTATFEAESAAWEDWVSQAQSAYRKNHNLSDDVGLAYPGMAPVLVSRGSLKEAVEFQGSTGGPQDYLFAPPASVPSKKKKNSKKVSNEDILYDDDDGMVVSSGGEVEGMAIFF